MATSLVACGGTGAHVVLALMRLHTLGYALGFFRQWNGKALDFPTLYLVDQDAGDGEAQGDTAWQMVRRLRDRHPGRHDWHRAIGRQNGLNLKKVTPLPVGSDRKWFAAPNDTLSRRFGDSPYLHLVTDRDQRDIAFSRGMMGSPAVGALLFRLKENDATQRGVNHDSDFEALRKEQGRIAVVGSGVGGTGAAVAPTLARRLAAGDADVMAVIVLRWFKFLTDGLDHTRREKADLRNDAMRQNASSALAYCGQALAEDVATVPIGVPDSAVAERRYTSDTRQPTCEAFVHGVAALCCLRHFTRSEPYPRGLYQMGAEDRTRFGGGNAIPGGTLQDLANQAETLALTLDAFATALSASHAEGRFGVVPAVYQAVRRVSDPGRTARALGDLVDGYRQHLEWIRKVGVEPRPATGLTMERMSREQLVAHPISERTSMPPEEAALELFHWVADWIRDHRETHPAGLVGRAAEVQGGYWPPLSVHDSISPAADHAGELTPVLDQDIDATLAGFVDSEQVSENGWPHPVAAADHFRYAIQQEDRTAKRQLEMLLAGLVTGDLTLREMASTGASPDPVSLEALVEDSRKNEFPELGRYRVVWPAESDVVLGFNSPHTLLCATPVTDRNSTGVWAALWKKLTGSEHPERWPTADPPNVWRHADRAVRQIRSWLSHLKQTHAGPPPAWTRIFDHLPESARIEHGIDLRKLSVYWNPTSGQPIDVRLPTAESGGYQPDESTPIVSEETLLDEIPEVRGVRDKSGSMAFELTEFQAPDRERPLRAVWREHLDELQRRGLIAGFGSGSGRDVVFIWLPDRMRAATLERTCIVDRDMVMVPRCSPMRQDPVPGSSTRPNETRYPHLPLRSEYIGLVQTGTGEMLLDRLKAGDTSFIREFSPEVNESHGKAFVTWTLSLKGRADPLTITLPIAQDSDHHQAHWMVWPRFRSDRAPFWRAYYVYEHCTDPRLHLETLWQDPNNSTLVHRCEAPERFGAHPILFSAERDRRCHAGGPPLAFSARDTGSGDEIGLYLIPLTPLSTNENEVKVGIDFGTSHTVASRFADGEEPAVVSLAPELDPANAGTALTLHVSENRSHVTAPFDELGLSARGMWLPTYVESAAPEADGLLPSELLTTQPLASLAVGTILGWQPGRDCVIPPMDVRRPDLAEHILADFKWDVSFPAFRGHEQILREIYLGMAIELIMADIVGQRGALPARPVEFTFTYPLRTQRGDLGDFRTTLRRALANAGDSLGCTLNLCKGAGIYNESRAAKGGTGSFGEVSLVGDLGGGTLDLFISANSLPGVEFEEVADSARLGGNLLLRTLARHPARFLAGLSGWKTDDPEGLETQLRAWMRSMGSDRLFGADAGPGIVHKGLDLRGFERSAQADPARRLMDRYFRLITEYMARSLVAFIARHWYWKAPPAHRERLRILVQLRGNGWRLWYGTDRYRRIEEKMSRWIEERARVLWKQSSVWKDPVLDADEGAVLGSGPEPPTGPWSKRDTGDTNPKTAPIVAAVGQVESPDDEPAYAHTLVEVDLVHAKRADLKPVHWFSRVPFLTGGKATQIELSSVDPPLPLSHEDVGTLIVDLDEKLKARVNRKLREEGSFLNDVEFRTPVAAIVWEAAFESGRFLNDD